MLEVERAMGENLSQEHDLKIERSECSQIYAKVRRRETFTLKQMPVIKRLH